VTDRKHYGFREQHALGVLGERLLALHWSQDRGLDSVEVPLAEQLRANGDLELREWGDRVEVKVDTFTWRTGNVFVEMVSKVESDRPGWGAVFGAEWLCYLTIHPRRGRTVPEALRLLYIRGEALLRHAAEWAERPLRRWLNVPNNGWTTRGMLISYRQFAEAAALQREVEPLSLVHAAGERSREAYRALCMLNDAANRRRVCA